MDKLRITIICGCLAPGQDGVGDYSRILAKNASDQGHAIQLISIRDKEETHDNSGSVPIHRFRDALTSPSSAEKVAQLIEAWQSDWLSLQFVNFSFHSKGLIQGLVQPVTDWRKNRKLHIMFHEYWMESQGPLAIKRNLHAYLQARQLKSAVKKWRPDHMDTSNEYYANALTQAGIGVSILPLFSNIPISASDSADEQILALKDAPLFVFPFAQHHAWDAAPVMHRLHALAAAKDIHPTIVQVGKNPHQAKHWPVIEHLANEYGWKAHALGPQDDATISALLHRATLGITSKHYLIAGKSGAVQAMREHDVPIFFGEPSPTAYPKQSILHGYLPWELSDLELDEQLNIDNKKEPKAMAATISRTWLSTLAQKS